MCVTRTAPCDRDETCVFCFINHNSVFISLLKADFGWQITRCCIFMLLLRRTLYTLKMVAFSFLIILFLMSLLKTSHQLHCWSWSSRGWFLGRPGPAYTWICPASGREQTTRVHTPTADRQAVFSRNNAVTNTKCPWHQAVVMVPAWAGAAVGAEAVLRAPWEGAAGQTP